MEVVVVLPVKPLAAAKSRLRADFGAGTDALALAMALDVVAAASAAAPVGMTVIVTNDQRVAGAAAELGARTVPDFPQQGLNAALRRAGRAGVRSARASRSCRRRCSTPRSGR